MKKFILMLICVLTMSLSVNAQTAVETSKWYDNTYVSAGVGATTPLTFDQVFPLNTTVSVSVGKWFNPVVGAEVEETIWLGSHYGHAPRFDGVDHLAIRGNYLGINSLVNLSNAFGGYRGTPRLFEVGTVIGAGWTRAFVKDAADNNGLGVKTGLDLAFNLGKAKEHALGIRPAVLWEITPGPGCSAGRHVNVEGKRAQLQLAVAYTYHFKTSNGTHHFKTYDIGALNDEINRLRGELKRKPKVVEKIVEVEKYVEVTPVETNNSAAVQTQTVVFFAQGKAELTDEAKETLNALAGSVEVVGLASPEGSKKFNDVLSQRRADVVKEYLESRGLTVVSAEGLGVAYGNVTPRAAVVKIK